VIPRTSRRPVWDMATVGTEMPDQHERDQQDGEQQHLAAARVKDLRIIVALWVTQYFGTSAPSRSPPACTIQGAGLARAVAVSPSALVAVLVSLRLVQAEADRLGQCQSAAQSCAEAAYRVDVQAQRYREGQGYIAVA
jgi:hypothetical protein